MPEDDHQPRAEELRISKTWQWGGRQAYLEEVEDHIELHGRLSPNKVVHPAGVYIHQGEGAADDDGTLEEISLVIRSQVRWYRLRPAMPKAGCGCPPQGVSGRMQATVSIQVCFIG
jgi:hypothetical protein